MGEVKELSITSVPQYFYVDTVEADAIDSITIRSGYETGAAVTSVYIYENDGYPVSREKLTEFCSDNSELIKIASVSDSKTSTWGYRTAVISDSGITLTEDSGYVLEDDSEKLDIKNNTGKKALIVGIEGNIGSKAYFDNIKLHYNRAVSAPMPDISAVRGNNVKDNSVIIDKGTRTITVPVTPGTDISSLEPEIALDGEGSVYLSGGTWEKGTVTVDNGSDTADWSISCVERGNPVLNGYYADPNIACFNGTYYIYPTTDGGTGWNSTQFKVFSSKDLVNWTDEGVILDMKDVPWSGGINAWAPTIAEKNGKYYFYFSAKNKDDDLKSLGVAVADSPTGPFVPMDEPIIKGGELEGQMIDPAVFVDDDGSAYIYWGNMAMYMAKLSDDMLSIDGEISNITPSNFREAAFVIKRDGIYYFMWSNNDTGHPKYEVHYGTSDSPYGPIEGDTTILSYRNANDAKIKATGHNSVVNVPGTDDWYICYHRFNIPNYGYVSSQSSEAGNHREVCLDKMEFNSDGSINPITPTLEGVTQPVKSKPASIVSCDTVDGKIKFELKINDDIDADIYTAVYDNEGKLIKVFKNENEGEILTEQGNIYTVKLFSWNRNTMEPVSEPEEKRISTAGKIDMSSAELSGSQSWENKGSVDFNKAADGDLDTYFDGLANGYVTIDLKQSYYIHGIGYAPRKGYESRMNGGEFYGSNDNSTWTLLYKVTSIPASGTITKAGISDISGNDIGYRYIKYTVPEGVNPTGDEYLCNIAEIELFGVPAE